MDLVPSWRIQGRRAVSKCRHHIKAHEQGAWQFWSPLPPPQHPPTGPKVKTPEMWALGSQPAPVGPLGVMGGGTSWSNPAESGWGSIAATPYLLDSLSPTIPGSAQYFILVAPAQAAELQAFLINGLKGLSSFAEASISASVSSTEIIFPNFPQQFLSPGDYQLSCTLSLSLFFPLSCAHMHTCARYAKMHIPMHSQTYLHMELSAPTYEDPENDCTTDKEAHVTAMPTGTHPHAHKCRQCNPQAALSEPIWSLSSE